MDVQVLAWIFIISISEKLKKYNGLHYVVCNQKNSERTCYQFSMKIICLNKCYRIQVRGLKFLKSAGVTKV